MVQGFEKWGVFCFIPQQHLPLKTWKSLVGSRGKEENEMVKALLIQGIKFSFYFNDILNPFAFYLEVL